MALMATGPLCRMSQIGSSGEDRLWPGLKGTQPDGIAKRCMLLPLAQIILLQAESMVAGMLDGTTMPGISVVLL